MAILVAKDIHFSRCLVFQEDNKVAEIAIASKQCQFVELVTIDVLHSLHDDCHIDLGLHLQVKPGLVHSTLLVRADGLLALKLTDIDLKAQRAELLIEALAVPGR